jgi:benzoate/toluate 1,2-dioxygenase beta subunit
MARKPASARPSLAAVEALLYREADCLDAGNLDDWIELYTADATYWMPVRPEQTDPRKEISLFYDDRLLMDIRRRNFGHELAPSMAHEIRSSHLIGNVRLEKAGGASGVQRVFSSFHVAVYYRREQTLYAGRYTHELVATESGLRIRHKRVDLINCDAPLRSILIYL